MGGVYSRLCLPKGSVLKTGSFKLMKCSNVYIFWDKLLNGTMCDSILYLFTGDIEQIAEKAILEKYGDTLKSTILKVAHHGSKSSSTEKFINAVKPKIALIGVGGNNNFGHPNAEVLERIERRWK